MMYYRKALMLQAYLERVAAQVHASLDSKAAISPSKATDTQGFELSLEARAQVDLKFTYVVTCQIYGKQKENQKPEAADIALLMQRNEALRVAFIDEVETLIEEELASLFHHHRPWVKSFIHSPIRLLSLLPGLSMEIYSVKLPGNPKLGEGKPENQNHAIIFTRGNAIQTIDMNQVRNLLEEFYCDHGVRPPTILGVREHVFTGSVSSLASFMSNQESSFVTLGQRVLANPLKGGISKASRVINIIEDIFSGFNSTLCQGNVTHHEYLQVGKGRDFGLNQIALFEGKVAGGNGEQVLSRDVYRLERADIFDNAALNAQFLFQIGVFSAVPMILGFILEQGFLRIIVPANFASADGCT
ncbi:unnamed protein product [Cuscuta campestris]|uniref:Glycosyl transferase 48 domain-containing protein n=1 Tax=Cuscuta campestris TaxID=132261 RepID=A0A484N035_9ASTE|nr:unnamed protein product [Cuscuta campestris]